MLEKHDLAVAIFAEVAAVLSEQGLAMKRGTIVDATLIAAPSSTKNQDKKRDPEMTQTKKGNQWHFGMKEAHIGVDAESGLIHTVECTTAKVADIAMLDACLHGEETIVFGDRGYHKANRTIEHFAKEGDLSILTPTKKPAGGKLTDEQKAFNRMLSAVRAIVEHPFRVVKRQFGFVKVRYRGLAKNTGADRDAVCAGQSVAGTQAIVAPRRRGAPVKREMRGKYPDSCGQRSKIACFSSFL